MSEYINGGASELVSYGLGDAGYNFGITSPDLFVYPTFIGLSRSYLSIWPAYEKGVGADQGLSDVILSGKPTFDSTIDLLHDFYSSGGNIFHSNVRDMTFSYPVDNMTAKSLYVVSAVGGDFNQIIGQALSMRELWFNPTMYGLAV